MHPLLFLPLALLTTSLAQISSSILVNCPTPPHKDTTLALLLQFKKTLHDPHNMLSNWKINETHTNCTHTPQICHWNGVVCKYGHVSGLSLNDFGLQGSIPSSLGQLSFLASLDLSQNDFHGSIPSELANCTLLHTLDLSFNNQLTGIIPADLGYLQSLDTLNLMYNNLTGGIPSTLANCTSLQELYLGFNQLTGIIPAELGKLQSLDTLHLAKNNLRGGIPSTLANCTSLQYLDLGYNQLTGIIPAELGKLQKLWFLDLSSNNLSGAIPENLANLTQLSSLYLSNNNLSGGLPIAIGNLTFLQELDLSYNMFSGLIPPSLSDCVELQSLDLSNNNLSGAIPESLGTLSSLQFLDLSHNQLNNSIPLEFRLLKQLESLDLSGNDLSGSIPSPLSDCFELHSLDLSNNRLRGTIPHSLTNLRLTRLDISNNNLQGPVPDMPPFNNIAYLAGNPGLCGKIMHRPCSAESVARIPRPHHKSLINIVIPTTLVATLLLGLCLCYWCCTRKKHWNEAGAFMSIGLLTKQEHYFLTAKHVRETTNDFSADNVIGEGSVSIVYRAVLPGGKAVAVKVLKNELLFWEEARFRKEVQLLSKLKHRNVVRVYGCCFNLDIKAIILEFFPRGNLKNYLLGRQNQEFSMEEKLCILRGVAQGLAYLHHQHPDGAMVHCDIKPENILLDADLEPRIADFGIAKLLRSSSCIEESSTAMLLRGSVGYIPPEYGQNPRVSTKGDVYSFGVMMLEILTSKSPTCSQFRDEESSLVLWARSAYPHNIPAIFDINAPPTMITMSEQATAAALRLAGVALTCTQDLPSQ